MEKSRTGVVRFRTGKGFASLMMGLTRQAYWMENRQEWALDTLACLRGITVEQAKAILSGMSCLEDREEDNAVVLVEKRDEGWIAALKEHQEWQESRTYLFGNRRVPKHLVDFYTDDIVRRLRLTMVRKFTPDALEMMKLEDQRRDTHNEIFREAGFSTLEIVRGRASYSGDNPEFAAFDRDMQRHVDAHTDWIFDKGGL